MMYRVIFILFITFTIIACSNEDEPIIGSDNYAEGAISNGFTFSDSVPQTKSNSVAFDVQELYGVPVLSRQDFKVLFKGSPLSFGMYMTDVYTISAKIKKPDNGTVVPVIDEQTGWSGSNPNEQQRYLSVVTEGDFINFKTWVYYVKYSLMGSTVYNRDFPCDRNNIVIRYRIE